MDEKLEKLIQAAKSTMLTTEEKSSMLSAVEAHMKAHPASIPSPYTSLPRAHTSILSYFNSIPKKYMAMAVLVLFVIGTSGAAAQNALPGDPLYPIKIHVNEKVESFFAVGTKATAEVNLRQADRRLKEAQVLAQEKRLTPEVKAELQASFSAKAQAVTTEVDSLTQKGDTQAAVDISTRFKQQVNDRVQKIDDREDGDFKIFIRGQIDPSFSSDSHHTKSNNDESDHKQGEDSKDRPADIKRDESINHRQDKSTPETLKTNLNSNLKIKGDDGDDSEDDNEIDGDVKLDGDAGIHLPVHLR